MSRSCSRFHIAHSAPDEQCVQVQFPTDAAPVIELLSEGDSALQQRLDAVKTAHPSPKGLLAEAVQGLLDAPRNSVTEYQGLRIPSVGDLEQMEWRAAPAEASAADEHKSPHIVPRSPAGHLLHDSATAVYDFMDDQWMNEDQPAVCLAFPPRSV